MGGLEREKPGDFPSDLPVPEGKDEGGDEGVQEGEDEEDGAGPVGKKGHEEGKGRIQVGWGPAEQDQSERGNVHPGGPSLLPPHQLAGIAHPVPEGP